MSLMRGKQKRKGKEKPHSDADAQRTETTDCVAFWDREIPIVVPRAKRPVALDATENTNFFIG